MAPRQAMAERARLLINQNHASYSDAITSHNARHHGRRNLMPSSITSPVEADASPPILPIKLLIQDLLDGMHLKFFPVKSIESPFGLFVPMHLMMKMDSWLFVHRLIRDF